MIEFTYLCDRVSADVSCEAFVTAMARCGWVKFRECDQLPYGSKFPLRQKPFVYRNYVRQVILYGSEVWCIKESGM